MGGEEGGIADWPPAPSGAPVYIPRGDHWTHFDNSVNAVSFGFVATAILISMFLVMAIFEKILRATSPPSAGRPRLPDIEAQSHHIGGFNPKLAHPSPKTSSGNAREVSVVMPGNNIPTFIAAPAPAPVSCPPERIPWPHHQHLPNLHAPARSLVLTGLSCSSIQA